MAVVSLNWGAYYFFHFLAANKLPWLRPVMDGVNYFSPLYLSGLFLLTLAMLLGRRQFRLATLVFLTGVVAVALVEGLRHTLASPRPPLNSANHLPVEETLRGFPARAVFLSFFVLLNWATATEFFLTGLRSRLACHALALMLAFAVTFSQLFLGLHFLLDVLAGMTGGVGLALLCRAAKRPLQEKKEPGLAPGS